ncbi:hypothetical protein KKG58_01970 [Patescibacteria group bacterium]|nr:hypothetical protein [Patescibacteria group bacterium]
MAIIPNIEPSYSDQNVNSLATGNKPLKKSWLSLIFKKKKKFLAEKKEQESLSEEEIKKLSEKNLEKKEKKGSVEKSLLIDEIQTGSLDISLMPEKTAIIPRIIRSRLLILITALAVIVPAFVLVWLYTDYHFEKMRNEVMIIEREMQFLKAQSEPLLNIRDEIMNLEIQAARAEKILNDHIYWTKFFSLLETYTIPDVYFGDLTADTSGIIRLDAMGRNLIDIAEQFIVFSQAADFAKEVTASNISKNPNGIGASFGLVLNDNVFKK